MSKLKPKQFDESMGIEFNWYPSFYKPTYFKNVKYIGKIGKYYLYWVYYYNDEECGILYRTKIENVGKEDDEAPKEINLNLNIGVKNNDNPN